jgi:hypothetical protein
MRNALLVILVFGIVLLAGCTQVPPTGQTGQVQTGTPGQAVGRVVFTMADKAADMGNVTSVKVTVDEIMVQGANQGWLKVASTTIPMTCCN